MPAVALALLAGCLDLSSEVVRDQGAGIDAVLVDQKVVPDRNDEPDMGKDMGKDMGRDKGPVCGNNWIEKGEVCDGIMVGPKSCKDLKHTHGKVTCIACKKVSYSGCYSVEIAKTNAAKLEYNSSAHFSGAWNQGGNAALVIWDDRNGSSYPWVEELRMQKLDSKLTPALKKIGVNVTKTSKVSEVDPVLTALGKETLAVWADTRNGPDDIYAARLNPAGYMEKNDKSGVKVFGKAGIQDTPAVACGGSTCLVVWMDSAGTGKHTKVRGGLLHLKGGYLTPAKSKAIIISTSSSKNSFNPAVATDGADFLVVFSQGSSTATGLTRTIWGRRVSASGTPYQTSEKYIGGLTTNTAFTPAVGYLASTSRYIVVWADNRTNNNYDYDIYGARVDKSAVLLPGLKGGQPVATGKAHQDMPSIACQKETCLVTYSSQVQFSPSTLDAVRLKDDKTSLVMVDTPAITLATGTGWIIDPLPFVDAAGSFIVIWRQNAPSTVNYFLKSLRFKP